MASRDSLAEWEVALIKAFLQDTGMNDQEILPYFSRPGRSINHRVIGEIRSGSHFSHVEAATEEQMLDFKERWSSYSVKKGEAREIEELILKARESQIAAIQIFNSPAINFRAEVHIVLAVIAWTYAFHALYKRAGVDYRYYHNVGGVRTVQTTDDGLEKYWDLGRCLEAPECLLNKAVKENLLSIIKLRNSISHRFTGNVDLKIASKLQAAALNFNSWLVRQFGGEYRIDTDFGVAIQMSSFSHDQSKLLYAAQHVDPKIGAIIDAIDDPVADEIVGDTRYAFNIVFVEQAVGRQNQADKIIKFVRAGTDSGGQIEHVVFKDRERKKFKPSNVVKEMRGAGFTWFNMSKHTDLVREHNAKDVKNGYGVELGDGQWYYYQTWVDKVLSVCQQEKARR